MENNLRLMMKRLIVGLATTMLLSCGVAGVVGASTAQARPGPAPLLTWCQGQPMPAQDVGPPLTWDMSVCHEWHYEGAGLFPVEGPKPPPNISEQCPGLIPFVNCLPGL